MRHGYGFFTAQDAELKEALSKEFQETRNSLFDFEDALQEITKPTPVDDINPDLLLYARICLYRPLGWEDFEQRIPRQYIKDLLTYYESLMEEDISISETERAIISALNRVAKAISEASD